VEYGGARIFPAVGVISSVEKGDAVFWLDLLSDGFRDRQLKPLITCPN